MFVVPKVLAVDVPHSPLARLLPRLPSRTKFPFVSFHVRAALTACDGIGLLDSGTSVPWPIEYLPHETLTAVLPLPNRSYAAPTRGRTSFQFGTLATGSTVRAGTNRPAGTVKAGTQ